MIYLYIKYTQCLLLKTSSSTILPSIETVSACCILLQRHFNFFFTATIGRGEYIRLLLVDAGVDFEYVRHTFDSWGDHKQQLLAKKIRDSTLPYIMVDGKFHNKTAFILRFLSYKLGRYTGSNEEEAQLADAYIDLIMD